MTYRYKAREGDIKIFDAIDAVFELTHPLPTVCCFDCLHGFAFPMGWAGKSNSASTTCTIESNRIELMFPRLGKRSTVPAI